jgi:hypothetical protein
VEQARAFAAAVLCETDVGRWVLAVLRGDATAARALVELAIGVARRSVHAAAPPSTTEKVEAWPEHEK